MQSFGVQCVKHTMAAYMLQPQLLRSAGCAPQHVAPLHLQSRPVCRLQRHGCDQLGPVPPRAHVQRPKRRSLGARTASRRASTLVVRADASNSVPSKPFKTKDARLVLEDGSVWHGSSFGAKGTAIGEVVFNTSLTGYQEIMTDPSYKGQFVCFTLPHIGNVGVNTDDVESSQCHLGAIIVRDLSIAVSNYRSTQDLPSYCEQQGVLGISNVDTRQLTKKLRETGCLVGVISTDAAKSNEELLAMTRNWTIVGKDLLSVVSCTEPYEWKDPTLSEWEFSSIVEKGAQAAGKKFKVVAYDFGIKHNILRRLASFGCQIIVVPATYPADKVMALNPDGVFFSNGPGDPSAAPYAVDNARQILGQKPVFGICMGHQLLGQAFGGKTFKLKFGHHGGNHPIRYVPTGRVEISAQNHNFAVDPDSLPAGVEVTHINLNDGTCAGMAFPAKKAMTIQYHPEASPGPHDADICFEQFVEMMKQEALVQA